MCERGSWWTVQATQGIISLFLMWNFVCVFDNPIKLYENCGKCVSHLNLCLKMINNRDSTMAALLFAIVLVFFVCHTPKAVINIYEVILEISFLDMHAMHTSEIPFYCMYVALLDHTHGGVWIYPLSLNPIQSSGVLVVELWMWKATKEVLLGVLRALSWYSELNYRSANGGGILRKDAKKKNKKRFTNPN